MKILLFLIIFSYSSFGQIARPTFNPFNNGIMPFYGQNQVRPNNNYYNHNFLNRPQYPNNTNHPLNFHRPNNFSFGRPNVNPNYQQPFLPQGQPQQLPQQQNWQQPQPQPQQPSTQQPQQPTVPLFTRKFHLNNGYLFGRPSLQYDPKSGKLQPWQRKNLR